MKLFLDSADPEKIRRALDFYPLDGVTTNPTILSRQNTELLPLLKELRKITEGKLLFVQVTADKSDDMVCEAQKIAKLLGGDICIKIPATEEGLRAIKILSRDGYKHNGDSRVFRKPGYTRRSCGRRLRRAIYEPYR